MIEQVKKQIRLGEIDLHGQKENFIMANEYYDFIEFLQNKLVFEEVNELQKEFDGSFYNENLEP